MIIGGVFNSGILAALEPDAVFEYEPASTGIRERAGALSRACERYAVPLPAAALDFALRNPAVSAVVVGAGPGRDPRRRRLGPVDVPQSLRDELDAAAERW